MHRLRPSSLRLVAAILWIALLAGAWSWARPWHAATPDFGPGGAAAWCSSSVAGGDPPGDQPLPTTTPRCPVCLLALSHAMATPPAVPTLALVAPPAVTTLRSALPFFGRRPPAYLRRPSHAPPSA